MNVLNRHLMFSSLLFTLKPRNRKTLCTTRKPVYIIVTAMAWVSLLLCLQINALYGRTGSDRVDSILVLLREIHGNTQQDSIRFQQAFDLINFQQKDSNDLLLLDRELDKLKSDIRENYYFIGKMAVCQNLLRLGINYTAIQRARMILEMLKGSKNPSLRELYVKLLFLLRIPYRNSDKIHEGIDYYLSLTSQFEIKKDSQVLSACYYVLRSFYSTLGLTDKSIYYQEKSIQYLDPNENIKSRYERYFGETNLGIIGYVNRKAVLGSLFNDMNKPILALPVLLEAEKKYLKYRDSIVFNDACFLYFQLARVYSKTNRDSARHYLNIAFNLIGDESIYLAHYYLNLGQYFLSGKELDSAKYYLGFCKSIRDSFHINLSTFAGILNPEYYLAKLSLAEGQVEQAIPDLKAEIETLIQFNLRREALSGMELLVQLYQKNGNDHLALNTFEKYHQLHRELSEDIETNRSLSFETEQRIADQEIAMQTLSMQNEFNQKRNYYLIGINLLVAFLALGYYKRYRLKKKDHLLLEEKNRQILKEKERSEELLLNILPAETAEELKSNGSAKARSFNQVTVMFTDFKNFTQVSEHLDAEALVAVINYVYSTFDQIISKYNIEKIKTIGDSYMAASGLPVESETSAEDTTRAAWEILNFMNTYNQENRALNKPSLEIRIGIHTGPVVAGIVGIKKFAYDIWGDTVNIASRMESSGEAGKINISGSTYAFIKDKYQCTYRGKIQAKNKGEIDMYFVEGELNV